MSNGFNSGLQGTATGSAMNSVGLMFHSIGSAKSGEAATEEQPVTIPCASGVVSGFTQECLTPSQLRENILEISVVLNVVLAAVLFFMYVNRKGKVHG
jgi:hypothetical protein